MTGSTPAEVFRKIRRIEIQTTRLVTELFGGRYHSVFKGRGMEFIDVREYAPGDDIRSIHWSVTARLGVPFVKRFTEERELTLLIAVDVSGSTVFGTKTRLKSELAAELVGLLAFAALRNNDKVGLLLFSDRIETYIPPRKSKSHALRLVRDVLEFTPTAEGTNIDAALQYLSHVQKKRAIIFLISDFLDSGYETTLKILRRHHDTIAFALEDPMEEHWPKVGRLLLDDAESAERRIAPKGAPSFQSAYFKRAAAEREARKAAFARMNLDSVTFRTNEDMVKPLLNFFNERARRIRR